MRRLICWLIGHATEWKHPQQSVCFCNRCWHVIGRDGAVYDHKPEWRSQFYKSEE